MRFDYLMEDIIASGWTQSDEACLVDRDGMFLSHSAEFSRDRHALGDSGDPLEAKILAAMNERTSGTVWSPGRLLRPPRWIVGFHRLHEVPWSILLFAKGERILDPLINFRNYYAGALAICIGIILLLIRSVVGRMVRAITTISEAARKIARGHYERIVPGKGEDEIAQLGRSFNTMVEGLEERDFMADTFGRYVDPEIARELLRRPEAGRMGGEKREVAILISDLRGFTPLSESLSPEATIQLLNRHFSSMIRVIQEHRGIIVDFFGDSVLAFFDPLEGPLHEAVARAVRCALEMQKAMDRVNERSRKDNLPELGMGVGVHAGEVIVGNIGSETRAKYGIVGSAVNLTHRIQQFAAAGEIIVSDRVSQEAGPLVAPRKILEEMLKGVQEPVKMYVVVGGGTSSSSLHGKEV
jgi:class 3 adenylate cyclase